MIVLNRLRQSPEDGLDPSAAGPLFCAGITVFNPIVQNNIQSGDKVAVLGIGGLGHLALQLLKGWGCEVTALSSSNRKESEAKALGADHYIDCSQEGALEALTGQFDMILVMDSDNLADMKSLGPEWEETDKLKLFRSYCPGFGPGDVPDPYYGGSDGFELVLDMMEEGCTEIIAHARKR